MLSLRPSDQLLCQKLHEIIPDRSPMILSLFNKDAFTHDSYLELHYQSNDPVANLYFCGNGMNKIQMDVIMLNAFQKAKQCSPNLLHTEALLNSGNLFPYVYNARISGEKLDYILEILDECRGVSFQHSSSGRDGNIVFLKSFWNGTAEFTYWVTAADSNTRIEELVWLLADYLPRPARNSLQPFLPSDKIDFLRQFV